MYNNQHNKLFACHLRLFGGGAKNLGGCTPPCTPQKIRPVAMAINITFLYNHPLKYNLIATLTCEVIPISPIQIMVYNNIFYKLCRQPCNILVNLVISWLYRICRDNLVKSLKMPSS